MTSSRRQLDWIKICCCTIMDCGNPAWALFELFTCIAFVNPSADPGIGVSQPICRQTIVVYPATWPVLIECRQGKQKRGAVPHCWWWEQQMDLDVNDAIGSDE
jgi:hypothetical protein